MTAVTKNDDGIEVIEYHDPVLKQSKTYEAIFDEFKATAKAYPDAPAAAVAIMTAEKMGVSVQHVVESCATVHAANAARGKFERNE